MIRTDYLASTPTGGEEPLYLGNLDLLLHRVPNDFPLHMGKSTISETEEPDVEFGKKKKMSRKE